MGGWEGWGRCGRVGVGGGGGWVAEGGLYRMEGKFDGSANRLLIMSTIVCLG